MQPAGPTLTLFVPGPLSCHCDPGIAEKQRRGILAGLLEEARIGLHSSILCPPTSPVFLMFLLEPGVEKSRQGCMAGCGAAGYTVRGGAPNRSCRE